MIDILFFLLVSGLSFLFLTFLLAGGYWLSEKMWDMIIQYVDRHGHPHEHHAS